VFDHLSRQTLSDYRENRLTPGEILALDDHVAICPGCREALRETKPRNRSLSKLQASLRMEDVGSSDHLTQEECADYAKGRMDAVDVELSESHLNFCPECTLRVAGLRRAVQPLSTSHAPLLGWLKAALAIPANRTRSSRRSLVPRLALTFGLLLALVAGAAFWLQRLSSEPDVAIEFPREREAGKDGVASAPSPTLMTLNDGGGQITLDASGRLAGVESLPASDRERVKTALTTQRIEIPEMVKELSASSAALMGGQSTVAIALLEPIGRVIEADRPVFRWRPLSGALRYQVTITDPVNGYAEVASSPELTTTNWRADRLLRRGRVYTWQVIAYTPNGEVKGPPPEAGEARFRVLEQSKAVEIAAAGKVYAGNHLFLALVYAEAGLIDRAEVELRALLDENPGSDVASKLLLEVQSHQR